MSNGERHGSMKDEVGEKDERFIAFLRQVAVQYNRPPETPREEMWGPVAAQWRARREQGRGAAPESESAGRRNRVPPWAWGLGLAAALLIGVAIGRGLLGPGLTEPSPVAVTPETAGPAETETAVPRPGTTEGRGGRLAGPADDAPGVALETTPAAPTGDRLAARLTRGASGATPAGEAAGETEVEGARVDDPAGPESAVGETRREVRRSGTYRAAAFDHLGRSELFLTAFRSDPDATDDAAVRARDLLSDTRLFLDGAPAGDPHLRALMEDLELVLARIARLDESAWPGERQRIVTSLERGGVLSLLRSAIPEESGVWGAPVATGI